MQKKKAISLIVLVITIIVIIILATAIIMTLNNSNIMNKAEEAVLKTDAKSLQQELTLKLAEKKIEDMSFEMDDIYEQETEAIQKYIPSFAQKYEGKICIKNGQLAYIAANVTEEEARVLDQAGVLRVSYITQEEAEALKAKVEALNLGDNISTTDITKYVQDAGEHADKFVIYQGNIYYRYERTAYVERETLYAAELSCFMGDSNADGTLTNEDSNWIDLYDGLWEEPYIANVQNMFYVGNLEFDYGLNAEDSINIDLVVGGDEKYIKFIEVTLQNPEYMALFGLYHKIVGYIYLNGDETASDAKEIKQLIPILTKEEAKKVIIDNGTIYLKQSALSENEIAWCDENGWSYM